MRPPPQRRPGPPPYGPQREPATSPAPESSAPPDGLVPGGFETEAQAVEEDRLRIKLLGEVIPNPAGGWANMGHVIWANAQGRHRAEHPPLDYEAGRALRAKLDKGLDNGFPSPTLASSLHMRTVRQSVVGALLPALEPFPHEELRTFTIMNAGWVFTPEELDGVTAAQIKRQLRTHLTRIGVKAESGFLLAFLHGEFDPVGRLYTLHFHGVTEVQIATALSDLIGKWGYVRTRTKADPIMRQRIKDPVRQLSYLLKAFWPSKAVRQLEDGSWKRDRTPKRIPEPYHTQVLLWLDRQSLPDMTVMIGGWSRRRGGSDAMRRLYFSTVEG